MGLEGKFQDSCNGRAHTGGSDVTESVTKVSRAGKELGHSQCKGGNSLFIEAFITAEL